MNQRLGSAAILGLLAAAFLVFTLFNNVFLGGVKLDLTENGLYTLAPGSKTIAQSIDEPINLYFVFSDSASEELTGLRAYSDRVWQLLEQYEAIADGKINLQRIEPEPFTDEEDRAAGYGLQAVPIASGDTLYFGLAGTNALDDEEVIPFFQPDREAFLEYEISQLIDALARPSRPRVGVMSSIEVSGSVNMQTFQQTPAWTVIDQLNELFEVEDVSVEAEEIPAGIDLMLVIHPTSLSEETLFALDQFVMDGGRLLAFVDPIADIARNAPNPMAPPTPPAPSSLNRLTGAWGVRLVEGEIVGDSQLALQVSGGAGAAPVRHLAILGLENNNLDKDDVVTARLANINVATAGSFEILADAGTQVTPLIESSSFAAPIDAAAVQFMNDPEDLQQGFAPTGERYPLAVRITGVAQSAFADRPGEFEMTRETDDLNVVLVADVDVLSDRLWVQVQNFFGQRIATPWANNGDFVVNAVDNLVGNPALISVRGRGRFTRPFDVVQNLRREAESRYLESANDLQARLSETERKLTELEAERAENNVLGLTPEQEAAIDQFEEQKLRIRRELRDVRYQLDKDIDALGGTLKFLNVFLLPLVLTFGLFVIVWLGRREGETRVKGRDQ